MDRSDFLSTLPYLHKISPSSLSPLQQHQKLLRKVISLSEHYHHHHNDNDDNDIISKETITATNKVDSEGVGSKFPHGLIFPRHVASIEPIGYHNGQSIGPAFFSVGKKPSDTVASPVGDAGQEPTDSSEKEKCVADYDELENEGNSQLHDPALCRFRAALVPTYLPTSLLGSGNSNTNHAYAVAESHLTSPISSSASTYMTTTPSQSSPNKLNNNTRTRDDISARDITYILYFWFGRQVYCVDHGQICSIHMEPASSQCTHKITVPTMSKSKNRTMNNDNHGDEGSRQTGPNSDRSTKPSSLVITFDSCSFRIFELPPSPSKTTKTLPHPSLWDNNLTEDEHLQQEKYLEHAFTKLKHFLSSPASNRQPLLSPASGNTLPIPFHEYLFHIHMSGKDNEGTAASSSSSALQSSEESGMRHENGQVTGAQVVETLLFQDQTSGVGGSSGSSQGGVIEGKDGGHGDGGSGGSRIGNATDGENRARSGGISSSSLMGDRCAKIECRVGDTNVAPKNGQHLQMKRKLESYQKSWFALQSIHSIMNPTTTMSFKRRRRRYKGEGNDTDDVALMMMKCSQELSASYYGSIKITCATDDKTENHPEDEKLSSRHTDEEMLKEKLSCMQKELDDAIRLIFPAPMKGRAKKSRFTAATTKVPFHSTNSGCDVNDLKQEIEKCLRNHREMVMKRHSLAFLPVRYLDNCTTNDG